MLLNLTRNLVRRGITDLGRVKEQTLRDNRRWFSKSVKLSAAYESPLPETFYNEEQKEIQKTVFKIIENDINPYVDEWEEKHEFPSHKLFKQLGEAGLLGVDKPEEYGGLGYNFKYLAVILESIGAIKCAGVPMAIAVQISMTQQALNRFGSDELKKEFMAPSISGDYVACVGISEPGAGSDVASIKTTAVRKGDDLIINGQKMWITNGLYADWICLLANTSDGSPYKNKSLICVPLNVKGVSRSKIDKLGNHSSDTAILFFDDVRVPAKNIIGDEGAGFLYQMLQFQEERLAGALASLLALDTILSETIEYTTNRKAFGKSILSNQVVHFRLAEMATEVEMLRALTYHAVDSFIAGQDVTRLASMVKLKAGRLSREIADGCLQFWGGMGYSAESPVSRYFRDARLLSIGAGADEVMLEIICKLMNTSPMGKLPQNK